MRLSARLVASHLLVAAAGAATTFAVVRLSAPALFDRTAAGMGFGRDGTGIGAVGLRGAGGRGQGTLRDAVAGAVNTAMLMGVAAALAVAVVAALLVSDRLLRPVTDVRAATRRIARGDYAHHVPLPREPELAALAADVNALATELGQTESRRIRLLGDVAHEMRTPLTVLEGQVQGLQDGVFEPSPQAFDELAGHLTRLHRLADDLSALSRVQEHRLELTVSPVDLVAQVEGALRRVRPRLAGIDAASSHALPELHVRGDAQRIGQVLDNLVRNAVYAMPDGGDLRVTTRVRNGKGEVSVTDTGAGLADGDLERIFERFYQVTGPAGRPQRPAPDQGSGVGLTVSRGIAEAHHGTLVARSPGLGQGSTFALTLPLVEPDQPGGQPITRPIPEP